MASATAPNSAGSPLPKADVLALGANRFRRAMFAIAREADRALDSASYGRIAHAAAAAALARRDQAAIKAYAEELAPYADALLATARQSLDELPPARHLADWRRLLEVLDTSTATIHRALEHPADPGSAAERAQHKALWPHLAVWAEHGSIATVLARRQQRPPVTLTGEEQHPSSEAVHDALRRGELELTDSWYAADGQQITLALLADSSNLPVVALRGDPDTPTCQVIGRYPHEYAAMQALPQPVPAGVLDPRSSRFNRPPPAPEVPLQRLIRDVVEAQEAPDAANAVLGATSSGYEAGSMVRLQELLETASRFAAALQTARGREIAARLAAAGRHLGFLTGEVREAAEDLAATVAVLPPQRTPQPHAGPRPAVQTTAPAAPPPASAPAPRR
ncbi:hypothetical protein GCM10010400_38010 [Streptomyces aculeolatus]|uniref:hypothetical protein n=1 Tax=Streptomyces aculeolatus TaxID=270689 RepID=UPI001CED8130|nr:hypothetical protein [Streptomyces aculeolatus]